jgi:hypothetical protein
MLDVLRGHPTVNSVLFDYLLCWSAVIVHQALTLTISYKTITMIRSMHFTSMNHCTSVLVPVSHEHSLCACVKPW